jgi:glycogen operon protein
MLVAGDEFGRSQKGNNNAWCQDNPTSWIDWTLARKNTNHLRFVRRLIALRKQHPIFRRDDFFPHDQEPTAQAHSLQITWQGLEPGQQDWSHECRTLAFFLNGASLQPADDDFFIMLNGHPENQVAFTVPPATRNRRWVRIIDTGRSGILDFVDPDRGDTVECRQKVIVTNMSCVVLQSQP